MPTNSFVTGEYVKKVPHWHTDDSVWKARSVRQVLRRNHLSPRLIGEVGCGTGEVLRQLQFSMDPQCHFLGYDIAPEAIELSRSRQNERLQCRLGEILRDPGAHFDVLLILDVLEHQENYFGFLRSIKSLARYKLFHTVLDLSAQAVLRKGNLSKRRQLTDDLHFFTKETLLQSLRDEQYEILDWFYVPRSAHRASGISRKILQLPRKICFALDPDFAARLLGGYSLFVLAK
jgi:2-polyprenyl-3-methyl-5-hydroxy-6-metoxy-1,4-benzoquinol methylase